MQVGVHHVPDDLLVAPMGLLDICFVREEFDEGGCQKEERMFVRAAICLKSCYSLPVAMPSRRADRPHT